MARYTNEPEQLDDCRRCTLLPTATGWVRAVQVGCPVHSEHPDARRVRTQAERDADGAAWRNRYATVEDIQRAYAHLLDAPPPPSQCRMHPTAARWMAARASVKPRALGGPSPALFGIPIIEDPDLPHGEWRLLDADGRVVKRGRFDQSPGGPETGTTPLPPVPEQPPADRSWIEMTVPPRRRWWHRLTRRNP